MAHPSSPLQWYVMLLRWICLPYFIIWSCSVSKCLWEFLYSAGFRWCPCLWDNIIFFYHSHFGHLYWKLCLHWAPGLQTAALEKLLVSAAPSSAIYHLTHIFQPHFISAGVILIVCLLNLSFYFPNWLILINFWVKLSRELLPAEAEDNRIIHITRNNEWSPSTGDWCLWSDW